MALGVALAEEPAKSFKAGDFDFVIAEGWTKKTKARAMSSGGLTYKGKEMKAGVDADFYHFGRGQGGGVEANIKRWRGQFSGEPKETERSKLAEGKVEFIHLEGTFLDGPPFGQKVPRENYAMLGAIIPSPGGDVFIKMTGSKEEVAKAVKAFKALAASPFGK